MKQLTFGKLNRVMEYTSIVFGIIIGTVYLDPMTIRSTETEITSSLKSDTLFHSVSYYSDRTYSIQKPIKIVSDDIRPNQDAQIIIASN